MKKGERLALLILTAVTAAALVIGTVQIYGAGRYLGRLRMPEVKQFFAEGAILYALLFMTFFLAKTRKLRLALLLGLGAMFTWMHQVFLPVAAAGIYSLFLLELGGRLCTALDRKHYVKPGSAERLMADFILGAGLMILLFCLLSLAGLGGIERTRLAALGIGLLLLVTRLTGSRTKMRSEAETLRTEERTAADQALSADEAAMLALIAVMLLLQAGRMTICVDYDSLHYGLRSEYILDNGGGIYENLGSVNVVYTYSKGLEILLLPLSGLPSFDFVMSFQLYMTAGILAVCGAIVRQFAERKRSLWCMAALSTIPGITNMAITAKTDAITALSQLILISFLLLYIRKKQTCFLILAVDAYLVSMVMKPTALVFSTAAAGTAGLWILLTRQLRFRLRGSFLASLLPMTAMCGLVWLRTFLLTGLPVTSVFQSIWTRLGFYARYPFRFDDLPSNGGSLFSADGLKHFAKRLYGVLLAPISEDMAHVRIAWGTIFLLIFLAFFFLLPLTDRKTLRKKERGPLFCLTAVFLSVGLVSLAALYLLWQVDGNYFILLYALFGILAAVALGKLSSIRLAGLVTALFVPVMLFNVAMTAVSSWGSYLGLNPVSFLHCGYYDSWAALRERMAQEGNAEIWDILAENPRNRVLSFGRQPEMLLFPCSVQSYTDIQGSGGNFYLAASPEAMISYLYFADMDYVYVQRSYLKPDTEPWNNLTEMIRRGYVTELFYEDGNALGRFTAEPAADGEEALAGFLQEYQTETEAGGA